MAGPILHLSLPVRNLEEARAFYIDVLDCQPGRVREDWLDVWFFGMQLTLQHRPNECRESAEQGVRHFGVALDDRRAFDDLVQRIAEHDARWLSQVERHEAIELSGKTNVKIADPSGNVIEIKCYDDPTALLATGE